MYTIESFQRIPGTEEAVEAVRRMAEHPEGWLILQGPRGCGKTHLLTALCRLLGFNRQWPWQCALLLDYWRSRYDVGDFEVVFRAHLVTSLFPLDDLGAERPTEWAVERLTMFLDYRYARQLPTVITTNLNEEEMAQKLGSRIADRVFDTGTGLCRIVTMDVPSFRTGRKW